jgi:hypothetical protein
MAYDFEHEAKRVIEAIEPKYGANMTVICALREAFEAGRIAGIDAVAEAAKKQLRKRLDDEEQQAREDRHDAQFPEY